MANLMRWRPATPSIRTLRRELDEILEDFEAPRALRKELDRLLSDDVSRRAKLRADDRSILSRRGGLARVLDRVRDATGLFKRGGEMFAADPELLTERDDAFIVRVGLAGMREEEIDAQVAGDVLTISGEHRDEATRGRGHVARTYGSFTRSIVLPEGVDTSKIEAHCVDGMLEVVVPKRAPSTRKQIAVGPRSDGPRVMPPRRNGERAYQQSSSP